MKNTSSDSSGSPACLASLHHLLDDGASVAAGRGAPSGTTSTKTDIRTL